jgi:glycine/serine hydroxymethyltransferase
MRRFSLAFLVAIAPIAAAAAALSPSAIVAGASSYDGKTVTVTGKVTNFQTSSTMMGTVAGFQLCDSKCVVVIDETNHARSNGSSATVTGTFHTTFKGPRKTFNNAVVIGR